MPAPRRPDAAALAALGDDALLASVRAAREAGDAAAATLALELLIWRHLDDVARRVALRVAPDLVEDVAHDVLVEAVDGAFGDPAIGGFGRRLDAGVRAAERPRRAEAAAEHEDDDDLWGAGLLVALPAGEPGPPPDGLPERLRERLAAYALEHRDGGDADPRAALAQVRDRDERRTLAAALDAFLAGAPPRGWNARAFAAAQRDHPMQRVLPRVIGSLGALTDLRDASPEVLRRAGAAG